MKNSTTIFTAVTLAFLVFSVTCQAQITLNNSLSSKAPARSIIVEEVATDNPSTAIRVSVDKPSRIYAEGELVKAKVMSKSSGYLYVIHSNPNNELNMLFPNKYCTNNRIPANQEIDIPMANAGFKLRVVAPFGKEVIKVLLTDQPIAKGALGDYEAAVVTEISNKMLESTLKGIVVEKELQEDPQSQGEPRLLADHSVTIETQPKGRSTSNPDAKTFALAIGISDFENDNVRDLSLCHKDAAEMQKLFRSECQVKDSNSLLLTCQTPKKPTLSNLKKVFTEILPEVTKPGDTILIYWSGHGGQCADTNGDEKDGKDEFLVPYDGDRYDTKTMLSDDAFGRWCQALDGRKVVFIIDACFSGGMTNTAKGIALAKGFSFGEMSRVKDLGQKNMTILTSSTSEQVSFERKEGDLSVMTHYFIADLQNTPQERTAGQVKENIAPKVKKYVQEKFPGATQTLHLQDDMKPALILNR